MEIDCSLPSSQNPFPTLHIKFDYSSPWIISSGFVLILYSHLLDFISIYYSKITGKRGGGEVDATIVFYADKLLNKAEHF